MRQSSILELFVKTPSDGFVSQSMRTKSITCKEESTNEVVEVNNTESEVDESRSRQLIDDINENHIGRCSVFETVYGSKSVCYADYTASGRALECIEDYIRDNVLPFYGNTHTNTSVTGQQTTAFREEAREIIAQAVNAKMTGEVDEDCVVFTGQGTTSAIHKLVSALGLNVPFSTNDSESRPIVFVGPFEHHSNLLSWKESCAEVIQVPQTTEGIVDVEFLIEKLKQYANRPLKIGSFSAASNLTGILTDVNHISAILHVHGALAFWDYATCAPYITIDMNPIVSGPMSAYVYKDAVFLSGHKFIGGPNSPGVLICKKRLLVRSVPTIPSGGTVMYVTKNNHYYLSNVTEREEGGTPDIIGSIRLGMAFELKQRVGTEYIMKMEEHHLETVRESLETNPHIVLLGRNDVSKLPIFSFLIRFQDRFLHYNFVCALLNDLFGIQTRGGCQCAGPYAISLLGISDEAAKAIGTAIMANHGILRGGFSRISFPYFMPSSDVHYILKALHFIANDGWKFLPQYRFTESGTWEHHGKSSERKCCSTFSTTKEIMENKKLTEKELEQHRRDTLEHAQQLAERIISGQVEVPSISQPEIRDRHFTTYRWFVYPSEAAALIKAGQAPLMSKIIAGPIQPVRYAHGPIGSQRTWLETNGFPLLDKIIPHYDGNVTETSSVESSHDGIKSSTKESIQPNTESQQDSIKSSATESIEPNTESQQDTVVFPTPPSEIMKWMRSAIDDWNMIQDGDHLLIGLSGGHASIALVHALIYFQTHSSIHFKIACATVHLQSFTYDSSPLKAYIESLGIPLFSISEEIVFPVNRKLQGDSLHAYTARVIRNALYTCCRTNKYNKLVLGDQLDDFAENFFVSATHHGQLQTMRAKYTNDKHDIQVIRPFVYVRATIVKQFAMVSQLVILNKTLPIGFEESKERLRVKRMLTVEENGFSGIFESLRMALRPMMREDHQAHKGRSDSILDEYLVTSASEEQHASGHEKKLRKRDKLRLAMEKFRTKMTK